MIVTVLMQIIFFILTSIFFVLVQIASKDVG